MEAATEPLIRARHGDEIDDRVGEDRVVQATVRIGQSFFRSTVLNAYNERCCITGLAIPSLLVASHIVPWHKDKLNRVNPRNGLLLSTLHDKAFDSGLITINDDMTVRVSRKYSVQNDSFFERLSRLMMASPFAVRRNSNQTESCSPTIESTSLWDKEQIATAVRRRVTALQDACVAVPRTAEASGYLGVRGSGTCLQCRRMLRSRNDDQLLRSASRRVDDAVRISMYSCVLVVGVSTGHQQRGRHPVRLRPLP